MIAPVATEWALPFVLYAETHYRFRYFFSLLKKNEPELIADAPHRLEPGIPLPLLVLAKDADRYPCTLQQVRVEIRQDSRPVHQENLLPQPQELKESLWWRVFPIALREELGWIELDVFLTIERRGRVTTYRSDNHRTSSHKPLRVFVAADPLPRFDGLHLGDAHTHSNYTYDQVEFGSPMNASQVLAHAMGLSFFCVTDHSYDLDDHLDTYLENHPEIPKWKSFQDEVDHLNSSDSAVRVIRGEEVTCRSANGKNVHLLLYGTNEFFPGSGDSAERWLRTRSELSLADILLQKGDETASYAAHPMEHIPFLQRLLLARGPWSNFDLRSDGLHGIQFANGMLEEGFERGKRAWVQALLDGVRLFAAAGNDAHGNFNRFRQIGIPFVKIREAEHQVFGKMRTAVLLERQPTETAIVDAFRQGRTIITDGPVLVARFVSDDGTSTGIGGVARRGSGRLSLHARSTPEFGEITMVRILFGELHAIAEKTVVSFKDRMGFDVKKDFALQPKGPSYVRIEVSTSGENLSDQRGHWCYTNPIWIYP